MADDRVITLGPGAGRPTLLAPDGLLWKMTGADTGGAYTMMELLTPPGGGSPWHVHHNEDESFFVLEGVLTIWFGDQVINASPGAFVLIPKDVVHAFANRGDTPVRSLVTVSPSGLEGFFATLAGPDTPRDKAGFDDLAARYGLEFFGPAPS